MKDVEYLDFIKMSTIKIKSFLNIGNIALPIIVDISKIGDDSKYNIEDKCTYYKTIESSNHSIHIIDELTPSSLFGKFKDLDLMYNILFCIYDFIDNETIVNENGQTILEVLNFPNKKMFAHFFANSCIMSSKELIEIYNELLFYIEKARIMFITNMKRTLDFEKTFPHIALKKKDTDIPEHLLKHAQYSVGMVDMQSIIEFGQNVIYSENKGKAFEDWSWREKYVRKMYLDLKARTDEYIEKIKAKQLET